MTRYKGRTSPKEIEKAFPHIVKMIVPLGGFGSWTTCTSGTGREALKQWGGVIRVAASMSDGALLIPQPSNPLLELKVFGKSQFGRENTAL